MGTGGCDTEPLHNDNLENGSCMLSDTHRISHRMYHFSDMDTVSRMPIDNHMDCNADEAHPSLLQSFSL